MTSQEIRSTFFNFFREKSHAIVSSAPMVVKNDPTLMFTNAGMNQFKDYFLGNATPKDRRVADTQKCLRVSGKHNDLEEVGHDTYHHTMFEMLGNWSFGDYFKKEAIAWAWELLTEVYKIDKSRMYATVFEGDKESGLEPDSEALELWKKYLPESHIVYGNKKDNFWEMGDTGPCGPCTEIHVDLRNEEERKKVEGALLINKGLPTVIEIWNLVFIQFNRKSNGELELLPEKHVDTGMGFERLCMVLQGKQSNYDTDVFQPIIGKVSELSGMQYGKDEKVDIAMRVVADHVRAISFSIADGQLPSNVKAGYVIRRILRRAIRYGFTFLNMKEPFICKLIPTLVDQMGEVFPELKSQQSLVENVISEEESTFLHTLEVGIKLLDAEIEKLQVDSKKQIDGKTAFILYDTYGFPYDLTELIAREKGFTVDDKGFEKELEAQKNRSRNAAAVETSDWMEVNGGADFEFVGYDVLELNTRIARYRKVKTKSKEQYQIVLEKTPFYGESGGQIGDEGWVFCDGEKVDVVKTAKENNLTIQITNSLPKNVGGSVRAKVDDHKRLLTANHHSATHLLHYALRQVLGNHVEQKGSMVTSEYLRFDFSHFQKISEMEMVKVEKLVNSLIRQNEPLVEQRNIPMEKARAMGAMALFGEKYGDSVRVIKLGDSVELCGGTHASATGQIGLFKVVSESAISAGVRRIEAVAGEKAEDIMYHMQGIIGELKTLFSSANLTNAARKTIAENEDLHKQLEAYMKEKISGIKKELVEKAVEVKGVKLIRPRVMEISVEAVKELAYMLRTEILSMAFVAGTINNDKPMLTLMLSDDLVKQGLNASKIVREAAKNIEGSGGGQPFFATAGGKKKEGMERALDAIVEMLGLWE